MADVNKTVAINYSASTEQLEKALKKIPNITDKQATKAAGALDKNFKKMESSADNTSKSVSQKMKNVGKSMAAVGAAAAVAITGVVVLTQKFADLTNELVDASTKTGIAVDTLAGLRLAAEGSGLSFSMLEGGLIKFQGSIYEASQGSKTLSKIFNDLEVDVDNVADGSLRNANDVFGDTIKALGDMEDETKRNALAMKIFGRASGPAIIQSGALENLESMTALATEFGIAIDDGGIQSMAQFQRSMAEFETVGMGTLQNVIGSIAGPNSLTYGIQGASQAMVYMGSIFGTVLGGISQLIENPIGIFTALTMKLNGDLEGSRVVMEDLRRETEMAMSNMGNVFEIAGDELDRFNELSEKSTGPQTMKKTGKGAKDAADELERLNKELEDYNNQLTKSNDESMDIIEDMANLVDDRLVSGYKKQLDSVFKLGNEIQNQIYNLEYEMDLLMDQAGARALSVEEQEALNNLVGDINTLEELHAENRIGEIIELSGMRRDANEEQKKEIEERKDKELQAIEETKQAYLDKVDAISDMGSMVLETFGSIADTITNINQSKMDTMTSNVEKESAAIDQMIKDGVLSTELGAERKKQIEHNLSLELQDMKMREYRMNKASALADIAFGLSKAIAQSLVLPPVARGANIALVSALAAAQGASVISQPAPKFDVGGMVGQSDGGPDVVNANLLRGEAVLDRATVDRLGGESGVQQLQNGNGVGSQVVIIQPFKHIDRYNRARSKRMATRVGSGGY